MRRRTLAIGLPAFGLAGCVAIPPETLPPDAATGFRRLSIVTAFDPALRLTLLGITRLDTLSEEVTVDWPLDREARRIAEQLLAPRYSLISASVDPAAIVETQRPGGFRNRTRDLEAVLRPSFPEGVADAVVVIASSPVRQSVHPMIGTPPDDWPYGLRVWGLRSLRSNVPSTLLIGYRVTVLDGRTLATVASASPSQTTTLRVSTLFSDTRVHETAPMEVLDFTWRGERWADMAPERHRALAEAASRVLDRSIPIALRAVGLVDATET
jgi:hypothetical protein